MRLQRVLYPLMRVGRLKKEVPPLVSEMGVIGTSFCPNKPTYSDRTCDPTVHGEGR